VPRNDKMKRIVIIMLISLIGLASQAQENKNKNAKYSVEVNGNCEMCKKRIEKAALSVKGVKSAVWNTNDHILQLIINEEKCSATDVKKAIAKVGYDSDELKATEEEYATLHGCCRYERK
jgi:periplasmic mercuric ion binding protein